MILIGFFSVLVSMMGLCSGSIFVLFVISVLKIVVIVCLGLVVMCLFV